MTSAVWNRLMSSGGADCHTDFVGHAGHVRPINTFSFTMAAAISRPGRFTSSMKKFVADGT